MSKIYIAGPMTGLPDFNRPAFNRAAKELADGGNVPLNPAILPDGLTQPEYMDICLAMLRCADGIILLNGWEKSAGARAEKALAEKLGILIFFSHNEPSHDDCIWTAWDGSANPPVANEIEVVVRTSLSDKERSASACLHNWKYVTHYRVRAQ